MSTLEDTAAARPTPAERGLNGALHIGFGITFAAYLAIYATTYASLVATWARTGTFEFAFLIFPVCAVLIWSRREWLRRVEAMPVPWALGAALALGLLWLIGAAADINLFQHAAVVVMLPVLVYIFYGAPVARVLAFPMGYMLFAIPFGNFMVEPLQTVTAHLAVFALGLTDIPVFMSGHFIDTPASAWHVAEACSGVKFFVATTAFGVLYAWLFFQRLRRRLIFIACAMVVPVVANGLRVFFTIVIGEHFGLEYATGTDHAIFGWQFFGAVLMLLFFAGWPWHEPAPRPPKARYAGARVSPGRALGVSALALVVVAAPAIWLSGADALAETSEPQPLSLPATLDGRDAEPPWLDAPALSTVLLDGSTSSRVYGNDLRAIRVDIARLDGDTITAPVYDATRWQVARRGEAVLGDRGRTFRRLELVGRDNDARWEVWYAVLVDGRWQPPGHGVRLTHAFGRLGGVGTAPVLLRLAQRRDAGGGAAQDMVAMARAATAAIGR